MKQHIKAIVLPEKSLINKGRKIYRYAIVGMLVTDTPISGIEGKNEIVLDCEPFGLAEMLEGLLKRKAKIKLGDASQILTALKHL